MRFVKPIDREMVLQLAARHSVLVTLEENVVAGGAGSAVGEVLAAAGSTVGLLQLGLPDCFIDHGDQTQLLAEAGLDETTVRERILARLA